MTKDVEGHSGPSKGRRGRRTRQPTPDVSLALGHFVCILKQFPCFFFEVCTHLVLKDLLKVFAEAPMTRDWEKAARL